MYCIKKHKAKSYSHWPVTITTETVNLDQKSIVTWKFLLIIGSQARVRISTHVDSHPRLTVAYIRL